MYERIENRSDSSTSTAGRSTPMRNWIVYDDENNHIGTVTADDRYSAQDKAQEIEVAPGSNPKMHHTPVP
ncbi:hypothetical protein GCM10020255_028460 [Rhodococcus baikonurensis]